MEQKLSLAGAGRLLGLTPNAVRARVKKNPELYRVERDNVGKIWLWLDLEKVRKVKGETVGDLREATRQVEVSLAGQIVGLEASLAAVEALRDAALAEKGQALLSVSALRDEAAALAREKAVLEVSIAAIERERVMLEADRDHWRDLAKTLAAKSARRWWPF